MPRLLEAVLSISVLALIAGCAESQVNFPARDFTSRDLAGNEITLSDYRGKVVLLDFWATGCPSGVRELPNVKRVYDEYKGQGFVVIGINLDTDRAVLEAFLQKAGIDWPQVFDGRGWRNRVSLLYGVNAIPSKFLIDRDGIIRYTNLRDWRLERRVERLLSVAPTEASPSRISAGKHPTD